MPGHAEELAALADELFPLLRERILGAARRDLPVRVLSHGTDVYQDASGNELWYRGGHGRFTILNFASGRAVINANTNRNQVDIYAGGMNIDYIVSSDGTGDYTALFGASGALEAAIATGANRVIWVCPSHSETRTTTHTLGALAASQKITVLSGSPYRATISFDFGGPAITSSAAPGALARLRFENIQFTSATGRTVDLLQVQGGIAQVELELNGVNFQGPGTWRYVLLPGAGGTAYSWNIYRRLRGSLTAVTITDGASNPTGMFVLDDSDLSLTNIVLRGSVSSQDVGTDVIIVDNRLTVTGYGYRSAGLSPARTYINHNRFLHNQTSAIEFIRWGADRSANDGFDGVSDCTVVGNFYNGASGGGNSTKFFWQSRSNNGTTAAVKGITVAGNTLHGPGGTSIAIQTESLGTDNFYGNGYNNWGTNVGGIGGAGSAGDHGLLSGLVPDDDHTQYLLLAGRAGGQSASGGTAASENLTLSSTAHATKGKILLGAVGALLESVPQLIIGAQAVLAGNPVTNIIEVQKSGNSGFGAISADASGSPSWNTYRSRGTLGARLAVADGDILGDFDAWAWDGTSAYEVAAEIEFQAAGASAAGDVPGRILFSTVPSGSTSLTERLRINSDGSIDFWGDAVFRYYDADSSNFVGFRAAAVQPNDITYVWPSVDPTVGQQLTSSAPVAGVATLSWAAAGGSGSSPLTTKGDIWGYDSADNRIPVGTDGDVLTADSSAALGVSWQTPAGASPTLAIREDGLAVSTPSILDIIEPDAQLTSIPTSGTVRLDLSGYALLEGRDGGQVLTGGLGDGDALWLRAQSDGPGFVYIGGDPDGDEPPFAFDEEQGFLGIGTAEPGQALDVRGSGLLTGFLAVGPYAPINQLDGDLTAVRIFAPDIYGSVTNAASGNLALHSTSDATKGVVTVDNTLKIDETNNAIWVGNNLLTVPDQFGLQADGVGECHIEFDANHTLDFSRSTMQWDFSSGGLTLVSIKDEAGLWGGVIVHGWLSVADNASDPNHIAEGDLTTQTLYLQGSFAAFDVGFQSSAALANSILYTLPATDPTAGQVLTAAAPIAGVSQLSWGTGSGGSSLALTEDGVAVNTPTTLNIVEPDGQAVYVAPTGIANLDLSQYVRLEGRSDGQRIAGGVMDGEALWLTSTLDEVKGFIYFFDPDAPDSDDVMAYDEAQNFLGIGTREPERNLDIYGTVGINGIDIGPYSDHEYVFVPDAGAGSTVTAGNQQGMVLHSSANPEIATRLYVDAETAPGASGLPITVQYGDTNDLDTVTTWTTIATLTLSSQKSAYTDTMSAAPIPARRLIRMNVGTIVGSPADVTITLEVKRQLTQ